jgi:hypothetical protein
MLSKEPEKRLTAAELLEEFKQVDFRKRILLFVVSVHLG